MTSFWGFKEIKANGDKVSTGFNGLKILKKMQPEFKNSSDL